MTSVRWFILRAAVVSCLLASSRARAGSRVPDKATVAIDRGTSDRPGFIFLSFYWDPALGAPGFSASEAVEFEVWVAPKCFAMPPAGRDDTPDLATFTRDDKAELYTDVWNYWSPNEESVEYLTDQLKRYCPELGIGTATAAAKLKGLGTISDKLGNFSVGARKASELAAGKWYSFSYPVVPADEKDPSCAQAKAVVRMQILPNTCKLCLLGDEPCTLTWPWAVSCPHIIGYHGRCNEYATFTPSSGPVSYPNKSDWVRGLCAPNVERSFTPKSLPLNDDFAWPCSGPALLSPGPDTVAVSGSSTAFAWTGIPEAKRYRVVRSLDKSLKTGTIFETPVGATSWSATGIPDGTWYWSVGAIGFDEDAGWGPYTLPPRVLTVTKPSIVVLEPKSGVSWVQGSTYDATWMSTAVSGKVRVEVRRGGGLFALATDAGAASGVDARQALTVYPDWDWSETRLEQAGLGVYRHGLCLVFQHSIPKETIPLLWAEGDVMWDSQSCHWKPLFENAT